MKTEKLLKKFDNGDATIKERLARIEALVCHVIDNDIRHLWRAIFAIITLLTGILFATVFK